MESIDVDGFRNRSIPFPRNPPAVSFILALPPLSPEKPPVPSSRGMLPEHATTPLHPAVSTVKIASPSGCRKMTAPFQRPLTLYQQGAGKCP